MTQEQGSVSQEHPNEQIEPEVDEIFENLDDLAKQEHLVRVLIDRCWESVQKTEAKLPISMGDLIRLFQFQRELEKERPASVIEVRWVDTAQETQP